MNKFIKISSGVLLSAVSVAGYATGYVCPTGDQLTNSDFCTTTKSDIGTYIISCQTVKGLQPLKGNLTAGVPPDTSYKFDYVSFINDSLSGPVSEVLCAYLPTGNVPPMPVALTAEYSDPTATKVAGINQSFWTQSGAWVTCSTSEQGCAMEVTTAVSK
jgi:hypothetical protein